MSYQLSVISKNMVLTYAKLGFFHFKQIFSTAWVKWMLNLWLKASKFRKSGNFLLFDALWWQNSMWLTKKSTHNSRSRENGKLKTSYLTLSIWIHFISFFLLSLFSHLPFPLIYVFLTLPLNNNVDDDVPIHWQHPQSTKQHTELHCGNECEHKSSFMQKCRQW